MKIPPNVRVMIVEELRKPGSVDGAIARRYGIDLSQVKAIKEEEGLAVTRPSSEISNFISLNIPERLRPFVIAVKGLYQTWPKNERVQQAKENYNAGLSETAIGRIRTDNPELDLLFMCEFPRKVQAKRRHRYFAEVCV